MAVADLTDWLYSKLRRITGPYYRYEGERPPRHMGLAYKDYLLDTDVYYLAGVHLMVNVLWWLNQRWNVWRCRESWIDREVRRRLSDHIDAGGT